MPVITRTLSLAILLATVIWADTLEVFDNTELRRHHVSTYYLYEHNGSMRIQATGDSLNPAILIWNEPCKCIYEIDPNRRDYKRYPTFDLTSYIARLIARPHILKTSKTVDIYYEAVDTGQRRQILGQTAKFLQVRVRMVAQPGACAHSPEEGQSGWYIAAQGWKPVKWQMLTDKYWSLKQARPYSAGESYTCGDTVIKHGAPISSELLVLQETPTSILELRSISSAPLDDSLFIPPGNYKRVEDFTQEQPKVWLDILARTLGQLEDAIATWF